MSQQKKLFLSTITDVHNGGIDPLRKNVYQKMFYVIIKIVFTYKKLIHLYTSLITI